LIKIIVTDHTWVSRFQISKIGKNSIFGHIYSDVLQSRSVYKYYIIIITLLQCITKQTYARIVRNTYNYGSVHGNVVGTPRWNGRRDEATRSPGAYKLYFFSRNTQTKSLENVAVARGTETFSVLSMYNKCRVRGSTKGLIAIGYVTYYVSSTAILWKRRKKWQKIGKRNATEPTTHKTRDLRVLCSSLVAAKKISLVVQRNHNIYSNSDCVSSIAPGTRER
jgi:hypothetical protein